MATMEAPTSALPSESREESQKKDDPYQPKLIHTVDAKTPADHWNESAEKFLKTLNDTQQELREEDVNSPMFLKSSLGKILHPNLFFPDSLQLFEASNCTGSHFIDVSEASYNEKPCYFLLARTEIKSQSGSITTIVLNSYISASLQTLREVQKTVVNLGEECFEITTEITTDEESNKVTVMETVNNERTISLYYLNIHDLFLGAGADKLLQRLCAFQGLPRKLSFITFAGDSICHLDYNITRFIQPDSGEVIVAIDKIIAQKQRPGTGVSTRSPARSGGRSHAYSSGGGSQHFGRYNSTPQSQSKSTFRRGGQQVIHWTEVGRNEDIPTSDVGRGDIIAEVQARYLRTGACLDLYQQGLPFKIQSEAASKAGEVGKQSPVDLKGFGGNIEMISAFRESKHFLLHSYAEYLSQHEEMRDILADFMKLLLHRKPQDIYSFTQEYFSPF